MMVIHARSSAHPSRHLTTLSMLLCLLFALGACSNEQQFVKPEREDRPVLDKGADSNICTDVKRLTCDICGADGPVCAGLTARQSGASAECLQVKRLIINRVQPYGEPARVAFCAKLAEEFAPQ